jgi:bacterioferritin (cytochrome b1)
MKELAKHNPEKILDLLIARLTFERTGVKLYDSVISKIRAQKDPDAHRMLETLQEHRDEEKEHEEWLEEQVRALGGDAHGSSDMSRLEARESKGIEDIVLDGDNDALHLFHALLAAELADNANWDLLVQIADQAGDRDAKKQFKKRLHEEMEHLVFIRRVIERLARRVILGESVEMPTWP